MKEYFSHDYNARNDTKLVKVFMKHGLSGIGAFWCIIEMLYEESGYLIRTEYERIAFELRTEYDTIKSVVEDFELFEFDGDKFYSSSALERLNERMTKSEKARKSVQKRWEKHKRNTNVLDSNNDRNTSKVKESKVKDSKVKDSKGNEIKENNRESGEPLPPKKSILEIQEEKKGKFLDWLKEVLPQTHYADQKDELNKFFAYWVEAGPRSKKLRWEKENAFDMFRRLNTWFSNKDKFSKNQNKSKIEPPKTFSTEWSD
jgi:hypothetical protein